MLGSCRILKILLTGITGLVGASFVTATLRKHKDVKIVAICRGGRTQTAAERVYQAVKAQCEFDGAPESTDDVLKRIDVISGDVGKLPLDEIKAKGPYDVFFHCAADVNLGKDPDGKTYQTNYNGTVNVLSVVKALSIPKLHYVSTAYVAGTTAGRVMEGELPAKGFNNSYENSKFDAEKLVRSSGIPFTIYRPSIIIGRLSDGLIRKPLAFYRILEFLGKVKKHRCTKAGIPANSPLELSLRLESATSDKIYFVPVDFVQKSISELFWKPVENKCYHITGESPVSTKDIEVAVSSVLKAHGLIVMDHVKSPTPDEKLVQKMIGDLMPYFASQITFDNTNIRKALGDEALAWKIDVEFLKKMAISFYRQTTPELLD